MRYFQQDVIDCNKKETQTEEHREFTDGHRDFSYIYYEF